IRPPIGTGRGTGMLRIVLGWQYPRNLGQSIVLNIVLQILEGPVPHSFLVVGRSRFRIAKTLKGKSAMHGPRPVIIGILIYPPTDSRFFQNVRDGRPFKRIALIAISRIWHLALYPA